LGLRREDVSRLASVSLKSVRYDDAIPEQVRERLEEIAITINMVAKFFDGDTDKTVTWFKARNPLLGDISPRDMIRVTIPRQSRGLSNCEPLKAAKRGR